MHSAGMRCRDAAREAAHRAIGELPHDVIVRVIMQRGELCAAPVFDTLRIVPGARGGWSDVLWTDCEIIPTQRAIPPGPPAESIAEPLESTTAPDAAVSRPNEPSAPSGPPGSLAACHAADDMPAAPARTELRRAPSLASAAPATDRALTRPAYVRWQTAVWTAVVLALASWFSLLAVLTR